MLTIIIIFILALAFYNGYRQGMVMQLIRLVGYVITFIIALMNFDKFTKTIEMLVPFPAIYSSTNFTLYNEELRLYIDQAFYNVITVILIMIIGFIITQIVSVFFSKLSYMPTFENFNGIIGGLINVFVTYFGIFIFLFTCSLLPIEWVQQQFVDNPFIYWIVSYTPLLSDFAVNTWLVASGLS